MHQTVIDAWSGTQETEARRNGFSEFDLNNYKDQKDVYILAGIDDITLLLEDCMVTIGTFTASRFVGGIREKVEVIEMDPEVLAAFKASDFRSRK